LEERDAELANAATVGGRAAPNALGHKVLELERLVVEGRRHSDNLRHLLDESRRHAENLERRVDELEPHAIALERRVGELAREHENASRLRAELDALHDSYSWIVTSPLRALLSWFARFR